MIFFGAVALFEYAKLVDPEKMLNSECLATKFSFDTAKNELVKVN